MTWDISTELQELLNEAQTTMWLPQLESGCPPLMRRLDIERILPHRDPFLFLDDILYYDEEEGWIAARYDLERGRYILSGHFPGLPTWPGIFQVEALNQAGGLMYNHHNAIDGDLGVLTHILAARFMARVSPGTDLLVVARVLEFGQMAEIVGQTRQNGKICSVAATRIYSLEEGVS